MENNQTIETPQDSWTDEQRKAWYIEHSGTFCPFCGSDQVHSEEMNASSNCVDNNVTCDDCNKKWIEIYHLDDVQFSPD